MTSSSMVINTGWAAGFAAGGYAVARLTGASPFLTAAGFALASIIDSIFTELIEKKFKTDENPDKKSLKNALFITCYFLEGSVAIAGCKQAGIISLVGVGILSSLLIIVTITACYRHTKRKYVYVDKSWYL